MSAYRNVIAYPWLPWRVRHAFETWTEASARRRLPWLYRLLHTGRLGDPLTALTKGPLHHFFGYYDKSPWNRSGRFVLAHDAHFNDRAPRADDAVTIGIIDRHDADRFVALATSHAWNWQQGAMLQWHPADPENLFVHNDRRDGRFVAVVRDSAGHEQGTYARPLYAIAPDGRHGYSLDFARLHAHRPGYGYAGGIDAGADDPHPIYDGIHRIELDSGRAELIVSLDALAAAAPRKDMVASFHWINHIQVAPDGSRLAFFHIWRVGQDGWRVRLYTVARDGTGLACALESDIVSHYDWLDAHRLLIWARDNGSRGHFWLIDTRDASRVPIGADVLTEDGHCSFSPDRQWVLNDTYPDRYDMRTLMLYRWSDGRRIDVARLESPKSRWWGEIRCDLHPRWSRDGRQICIDSVHSGQRQMYVLDVADIVTTGSPSRSDGRELE